jgi:hypothetical protein
MPRTIKLNEREWNKVRDFVFADQPASVRLIRDTMKRELGFTVRHHQEKIYDGTEGTGYSIKNYICLDFYDDVKETWFRMKYL